MNELDLRTHPPRIRTTHSDGLTRYQVGLQLATGGAISDELAASARIDVGLIQREQLLQAIWMNVSGYSTLANLQRQFHERVGYASLELVEFGEALDKAVGEAMHLPEAWRLAALEAGHE